MGRPRRERQDAFRRDEADVSAEELLIALDDPLSAEDADFFRSLGIAAIERPEASI